MSGVCSAEEVAARLGYSDTGLDPHRKLWHHRDEYLVEGGIVADEYRVLAIFEGGVPPRNAVTECPFYRIPATILSEFFPRRRSNNVFGGYMEGECNNCSGVRDNMKRDELVKAITGTPQILLTM